LRSVLLERRIDDHPVRAEQRHDPDDDVALEAGQGVLDLIAELDVAARSSTRRRGGIAAGSRPVRAAAMAKFWSLSARRDLDADEFAAVEVVVALDRRALLAADPVFDEIAEADDGAAAGSRSRVPSDAVGGWFTEGLNNIQVPSLYPVAKRFCPLPEVGWPMVLRLRSSSRLRSSISEVIMSACRSMRTAKPKASRVTGGPVPLPSSSCRLHRRSCVRQTSNISW
jgi:hypothetical protein